MTTNDFDRTARLWLEQGPTEMPDRALQAALDEIHITGQRRAWGPARRFSAMGNPIRFAAGAAAVVLAAIVGINLLPGGGSGGPAPTPSPSPSPTPRALTIDSIGYPPLEPGTYVTPDPFLSRVTFTAPAGWQGKVGGPNAVWLRRPDGRGELDFLIFEKVYADPCDYTKGPLDPLPGPSVDDLATALVGLPRLDVTAPTDIMIDGYRGKQLTLTAPSDVTGCTLSPDGELLTWELPLGAMFGMTPGEVDRVWILDVDGQRLVIVAPETSGGLDDATKAEVQAILDSIRIAPATPSASPS